MDTFAIYEVPGEIREAFWHYFMYGWEPGGFGMAVLQNDFAGAVMRAHPSISVEHLRGIALWFYNVRLPDAYGSEEKVRAWIALTDEERKEIMESLKLCPTVFDILRAVPGA